MTKLQLPLDLILKNANFVRRQTVSKHSKRTNKLVPYASAWGSLMWYFGEEKKDNLLADMLAECTANVSSTIIAAISGLYRASSFYLRSLMEFSIASFYFKQRNINESVSLPRWRELKQELNGIDCFKKYNNWCIRKQNYDYRLTKLDDDYDEISEREIHFSLEVTRWEDVGPFYRRSIFCEWNDTFVVINQDLLFMWLIYFVSIISKDVDKSDYIAQLRKDLLRILGKIHKDYIRKELNLRF